MKPRRVDQLLRALQLVHRPPQNDLLDRAARDEADDSHWLGLPEAVHARRRLNGGCLSDIWIEFVSAYT